MFSGAQMTGHQFIALLRMELELAGTISPHSKTLHEFTAMLGMVLKITANESLFSKTMLPL